MIYKIMTGYYNVTERFELPSNQLFGKYVNDTVNKINPFGKRIMLDEIGIFEKGTIIKIEIWDRSIIDSDLVITKFPDDPERAIKISVESKEIPDIYELILNKTKSIIN